MTEQELQEEHECAKAAKATAEAGCLAGVDVDAGATSAADASCRANAQSQGGSVIDEAVATARAANIKMNPATIKVMAPAKVNLHLAVGPAGDNGFHSVETVLHAVALHDVLYLVRRPEAPGSGLAVDLTCTFQEGLPNVAIRSEENLAYKAVFALAQALGRKADETLVMLLEKRIPVQAGLGGGSSDAAAALVAAARAWGVATDDARVEETARSLGADVAFFLHGGCGVYEGKGDRFVRALAADKRSVVLVKPDAGVSTARAYAAFDANPQFATETERAALAAARAAADVTLRNNLAPAAESLLPELSEIRTWLEGLPGVQAAMLSGSGSATFAVCDSFEAACAAATAATKRGWWARTTAFSSARAAVVPRAW